MFPNGMPNLANLFGMGGGLGSMTGLGGIAGQMPKQMPKSPEELRNNPQMMSVLSSLENNPSLLNAVSAMSGMDSSAILSSVKAFSQNKQQDKQMNNQPNNEEKNEKVNARQGEESFAGVEGFGALTNPANIQKNLEALQGIMGCQNSNIMQGVSNGFYTGAENRGGDALANLLNRWHWTPVRN